MKEIDDNRKRSKTLNNSEQGDEDIATKKINIAIEKLKGQKSIGQDEKPKWNIHRSRPHNKRNTNTINQVHQDESIPNKWLQCNIARLYKGKGTKCKCSNESGITLASNAGKVYERIKNERVKNETEITEAQAGGIPDNATANHLIALKQTVRELNKRGDLRT